MSIGIKSGGGGGHVSPFPFPNHTSGSWANETPLSKFTKFENSENQNSLNAVVLI
jgi:hypothetical protein